MQSPIEVPLLLVSSGADKWRALNRYIGGRLQIVAVVLVLLLLLVVMMLIHTLIVLLPSIQVFMEFAVVADVFLVVGVLQLDPYVFFLPGDQIGYGDFEPAAMPASWQATRHA